MTALAAPAASRSTTAAASHAQLLDQAYEDYCRRHDAGDPVADVESFCRHYEPVRSSLFRLITAHQFLEENPQLLGETNDGSWPRLGESFAGFHIVRELGRGAFARVYLAKETALGDRLVAIKVTPQGAHEASLLGRVHHPNIVPIHAVHPAPERGLSIVCMAYRGGVTLHHVFDRLPNGVAGLPASRFFEACGDRSMPEITAAPWPGSSYQDCVRQVGARIADALAYLHSQGTCHRDLKPSNVLVQPDGEPLLLDFNLSSGPGATAGPLGGTPIYMAPEQLDALVQCDAARLDAKADVYALGVILYEWLTGRHPFGPISGSVPLADVRATLLERQRHGAAALDRLGIDRSLATLVHRCLAFDPAERPSAAEVARELQRQLRSPQRLQRTLRRHPRILVCAVLALAGFLSLGAAYFAQRPTADRLDYERGRTAYAKGKFEEALTHFNAAILEKNDSARYFFARAKTYQELGEKQPRMFSFALMDYELAEKMKPDGRHAAGMAYCLQRAKQQRTVIIGSYNKAIENGFTNAALLNNLGYECSRGPELTEAIEHLQRSVSENPSLASAHWNLASANLAQAVVARNQKGKAAVYADYIGTARAHIKIAMKLNESTDTQLAYDAARIFALAADTGSIPIAEALDQCEMAVSAGVRHDQLARDHLLAPLRGEPRFLALRNATSTTPSNSLRRIVDPLEGEW